MTVSGLYMTVTNVTGIKSIRLNETFGQAVAQVEVKCTAHTLSVGDLVTVDFGYATDHAVQMTGGMVVDITADKPSFEYTITIQDKLTRAIRYFMASDDPDAPFSRSNIKAEDLVVALLGEAGITGVVTEATIFTYGTVNPTTYNLVSVWDAVDGICKVTGFSCYVDAAGTTRFKDRKPYIVGGDVSAQAFASGTNIKEINYKRSTDKLRNKIVVYGAPGITAVASAVSAYLPAGFYQTIPISTHVIDSQAMATDTAAINLTMFNRLTENVSLKTLGVTAIRCRSIVGVTDAFVGLAGSLWFVYRVEHNIGPNGYEMTLELVR